MHVCCVCRLSSICCPRWVVSFCLFGCFILFVCLFVCLTVEWKHGIDFLCSSGLLPCCWIVTPRRSDCAWQKQQCVCVVCCVDLLLLFQWIVMIFMFSYGVVFYYLLILSAADGNGDSDVNAGRVCLDDFVWLSTNRHCTAVDCRRSRGEIKTASQSFNLHYTTLHNTTQHQNTK